LLSGSLHTQPLDQELTTSLSLKPKESILNSKAKNLKPKA